MVLGNFFLIGYSLFLLLVLIVNLLYFFQVFKYRLPGDVSLVVLSFHVVIILAIIGLSLYFV